MPESPVVDDPAVKASAQPKPAEPKPVVKPRRWRRRLLILLTVAVVLIAAAPMCVRLAPVKNWIFGRLSTETGLTISAAGLRATWWGPIRVESITVLAPGGDELAAIDSLRTSKSLFGLMTRGVDAGRLELASPKVSLDLRPEPWEELVTTLQQVDPRRGLLQWIVNPERDVQVVAAFTDGELVVRTARYPDAVSAVSRASADVHVDKRGRTADLEIATGLVIDRTPLTPALCDLGLKYVLPVLADALLAEGELSVQLDHCHLPLSNLAESRAAGILTLHALEAEVQAPLVASIGELVGTLTNGDVPLRLRITEEDQVWFLVEQQRVLHENLRFGLPAVLPELTIVSEGTVGFDGSLDLAVGTDIPFERFGESPLLEELGVSNLRVPITGSLSDPNVDLGSGRLFGDLTRDVTRGLTGEEVDLGPVLDRWKRFRETRQAARPEQAAAGGDPESGQREQSRRGTFNLRDRLPLLKKRREDGADSSPAAPQDPERPRRGLFRRRPRESDPR